MAFPVENSIEPSRTLPLSLMGVPPTGTLLNGFLPFDCHKRVTVKNPLCVSNLAPLPLNLAAGNWTNLRLALLDNFSIFSTFAVFSVSLALYEHTFLMPIINTIDTIILFSHFSLREIAIDYYSRLFPSI